MRRLAHRAHRWLANCAPDADPGFCAKTDGALALFGTTWLGIAVLTPYTVTGSIVGVGVGAARRGSAARWGVARSIVVAWGITLPASALVAAACYRLATALI